MKERWSRGWVFNDPKARDFQAGRGADEEAMMEASFQGGEASVAGGERARRKVRHEVSSGGLGGLYRQRERKL